MSRYIDADLLKIDYFALPKSSSLTVSTQYVSLFQILNAPTANVRENVHAHWIHERLVSTGGGSYPVVRCSACQWQYPMSETKFCPNCGAVMDERSEDGEIHNC